jgi:hypothetical protein
VFGGEHAGGCAVHVSFHGFPQRFLHERSSGRQELDKPACDHDVFALHRPAPRLEVLEDGLRTDEAAARFRREGNEDVHIQRGHWFEVKGRAHRAANGVAVNDPVSPHLIDGGDSFLDVHPSVSF